MNLVIVRQDDNLMQVGVDGVFYGDLNASGLAQNIHAIQWDGESGEVEIKNPDTGDVVENTAINSVSGYQFAVDRWESAKALEEAEIAAQEAAHALATAKLSAYQSAYDQAIANGNSEEDANAAGQAASDAVTSA